MSHWAEFDAVDRSRLLAGLEKRTDVRVVDVAVHRQSNVTGITPDAEVGDHRIVRYPVQRRVGLDDEPAVRLGLQVPTTSRRARVTMSIHGESVSSGSGSWGSCRISSAQIICVHVVPHFGGVAMMMSPGRSSKPSQRLLSYMVPT